MCFQPLTTTCLRPFGVDDRGRAPGRHVAARARARVPCRSRRRTRRGTSPSARRPDTITTPLWMIGELAELPLRVRDAEEPGVEHAEVLASTAACPSGRRRAALPIRRSRRGACRRSRASSSPACSSCAASPPARPCAPSAPTASCRSRLSRQITFHSWGCRRRPARRCRRGPVLKPGCPSAADRGRDAQQIAPDHRARVAEPGDLRPPRGRRRRERGRRRPALRTIAARVDAAERRPVDARPRRAVLESRAVGRQS